MNQHDYYSMNATEMAMYDEQKSYIGMQQTPSLWESLFGMETYSSPLGAFFRISDQEIAYRKHRYEQAIYQIKKQPFYLEAAALAK